MFEVQALELLLHLQEVIPLTQLFCVRNIGEWNVFQDGAGGRFDLRVRDRVVPNGNYQRREPAAMYSFQLCMVTISQVCTIVAPLVCPVNPRSVSS